MLIHLTSTHLTTHHAHLTCPLPRPPLGSFQKMPHLCCCDGLPAVMQEFPTLACLFALPPLPLSFTSLYLAMWCAQKSTIQSHPPPPLPVSRPSVYLRFFVLLLPQLSRAPSNAKFRSGTQADIKHTFQLWRKEAGMWNRISVIDPRVIVTKYPWTAAVYWTCSRVVTEGPSQY